MKNSKRINPTKNCYKKFKTPFQIEKWAKQYYLDWSNNFKNSHNKDILDYLKFYFGQSYKKINYGLRNDNLRENEVNSIRNCIKMINAAPEIPENITVYRAVDKDFFINTKVDNFKFLEKGFMSTSLLKESIIDTGEGRYTPYKSCKYILKIHINKGTHGIYSEFIKSNFGGPSNEYEILFPPDVSIKLVGFPYYNFKSHRWIFTLEML